MGKWTFEPARVPLDIKNSCVARGFSPCLTAGSNEPIGA